MSQENVEVVRRWNLAMSAGLEEIEPAIEELWDPHADFYPVRKFPESRPCHGREEFLRFMRRLVEAFPVSDWKILELVEVGDDRVLGCTNLRAEGRGSGVTIDGDLYQSVWLRHGRILRMENHLTLRGAINALGLQGETLEAVGLSE